MKKWRFGFIGILLLMTTMWGRAPYDDSGQMGWGPMGGPGMMHNWGGGWFGGIFMIIVWIAVIVGIVYLVMRLLKSNNIRLSDNFKSESALDVLKKRYAGGEIDKEEFEQMKRDLTD